MKKNQLIRICIYIVILAVLAYISAPSFYDEASRVHQQSSSVYSFRDANTLESHYKKHGQEMGYSTALAYQARANEVIQAQESLNTKQNDGDTAYFLKSTGEFVVLSPQNVIRTFFIPENGMEYFERQ